MSFADELRKDTQAARDQEAALMRSERAAKQAAEEAKRLAEISRANGIIAAIESKCKEAAAKGKMDTHIMDLNQYSFKGEIDIDPPRDRKANRKHLALAASLVWTKLVELGLKPVIKWDHDGVGIEDWYELYATWGDE